MTFINPINIGAKAINAANKKPEAKAEEKAQAQGGAEVAGDAKSQVSADKILDFMAAGAMDVRPTVTKTIDPAKYVDSASAERIAGFMASFEDKVAEGLAAFDKEFAGMNVSDNAKMAVVLQSIDNEIA